MAEEFTVSMVFRGDDQMSRPAAQMNQQLQGLTRNTKDYTSASQQAERSAQGFGTALKGALTFLSINTVKNFAEDMYALGESVRTTRAQFVELADDIGGSEQALTRLRSATGNVNDDLELMTASSHLLRTGLVDDSAELATLVGRVQDLKPATQDLAGAVMTISQGMQTGSARGLNQFGLNVEAVQAKIEALKDSGYSVQDAFKEAVYDEMANAVERLGSAADADETALARLQTRVENFWNVASERFAIGANGMIGYLEAVGSGDATRAFQGQMDMYDLAAQLYPEVGPGQKYSEEQWSTVEMLVGRQREIADLARQINREQETAEAAQTAREQQTRDFYSQFQASPESMVNVSQYETFLTNMTSLRRGMADGVELFTEEEAGRARAVADALQHMVDNTDELQPFIDSGMISQDDVDHMKDVADEAENFADRAERGADAISTMTLPQFFGQTSGGLFGQIEDQVLSMLEGSIPDSEFQQLRTGLDLTGGRETNLSQAFQYDVLPLLQDIFRQEGASGLSQAIQNLSDRITEFRQQGIALDPATLSTLTGYQRTAGGGMSGTVEYGDTLYSLADRYGGSIEDYRSLLDPNGILHTGDFSLGGGVEQISQMSGAVESMATNAPVAETAFAGMSDSASALQTSVDAVKGVLDEISSAAYTVTLDLAVNVPAILQWLFSQIGAGGSIEDQVRARGGAVPGGDPRAYRIAQ